MNSPDLLRTAAVAAAGVLAFAVSLWAGYLSWRHSVRTARETASRSGAAPPQAAGSGAPAVPGARSALPFLAGLLAGLLVLGAGTPWIVPGDRFYTGREALWIIGAVAVAVLLLYVRAHLTGKGTGGASRLLPSLILEFLAAGVIVAAGIRFTVLGLAASGDVELGIWAAPLTIVWLVAATWAVRLLDGLDGAAPVLLLTAAVAVLVGTRGTGEFLLAALSVVVIGTVLGSLRFHFFPARLPLRGAATALFGFVFAVLTVLARQKTVALLLLIFPLAVLVILLGGAMLNMLERTVFLPEGEGEEQEGEPEKAADEGPRDEPRG